MAFRVAIGGIWHETNTFARGRTTLDDFRAYQFATGRELLDRYRGTGTELGGMIEWASATGIELVPTLFAGAVPSATIARDALDAMCGDLVARVKAAGPLDGVLLVLHGAAAAEGIDDADAHVLAELRAAVGPRCPIAATFDFHANLGAAMVRHADVLVGYDTFPHIDMAERGREATELLERMLGNAARPARALLKLPLLTVPQMQATGLPPLSRLYERLHAIESAAGRWCGSIAMGFPYADGPELGAGVLFYADEQAQADSAVRVLANELWAAREDFVPMLTPVEEAVAAAMASAETPVILVDAADNVGGGAAGDGTVLLASLLKARAQGAVVVIADPAAVAKAAASGEGGSFEGEIGGKQDDQHGAPVPIKGRVRLVRDDARYRHTGSYMRGYETSMGPSAVIDVDGVAVVLTARRTMPFDDGQLRCLGIVPEAQRIIVVKSALAWRAAYGAVAKRVIVVDTPGVGASNVARLNYLRRPHPMFPLERDAQFSAYTR